MMDGSLPYSFKLFLSALNPLKTKELKIKEEVDRVDLLILVFCSTNYFPRLYLSCFLHSGFPGPKNCFLCPLNCENTFFMFMSPQGTHVFPKKMTAYFV